MHTFTCSQKLILASLLCVFVGVAQAKPRVYSWSTTAKHIKKETLAKQCPTTVYGGCKITKDWRTDLSSCNFYFRHKVRNTIDLEHIVSANRMRKDLGCGKLSRTKCRKVNHKFKFCHNNRANLFPAVSTINRYRGDLPFKELNNKKTFLPFGEKIGFRKSLDGKAVEPPERAKKTVGTAYLTMENLRCIKLNELEKLTYQAWSLKD